MIASWRYFLYYKKFFRCCLKLNFKVNESSQVILASDTRFPSLLIGFSFVALGPNERIYFFHLLSIQKAGHDLVTCDDQTAARTDPVKDRMTNPVIKVLDENNVVNWVKNNTYVKKN